MKFLSDDELDRLEADHPSLKSGICPTCRGKGQYVWQNTAHKCDCANQKWLHKHYLRAGIGITYQRMTWDDLKIEVPDVIHEYLVNYQAFVNRGMGLVLSGPVGTGKSLLTYLILKDLVKADIDCFATPFAEMTQKLISTWGDSAARTYFTKRFMQSHVLFLDDLGKEFRNKFLDQLTPNTFDYVLRDRVDNGRPTIITTNMTYEEMANYGDAVLSRLLEVSIWVDIKGDDYRPQAQVRNLAEVRAGETRQIV